MWGVRPLRIEAGSASAFTISLAPQRSKMSETFWGFHGAGTLERVSWQYMNWGGEPRGAVCGTRKRTEGRECMWVGAKAEGRRFQ